jgi:hypothetical protein
MSNSIRLNNYNPNLDNNVTQIINFEEPDLLIISKNEIYAIEHFRVDSTKSNKKGSTYKQKYNKDYENKLKSKAVKKLKTEDFALFSEKIKTPFNYNHLFDNVINNFENHYSKIENYINHINEIVPCENRSIKYFFFIQYDCIIPSFILNIENKMCNIFPSNDIKFIDFLKLKSKLTGIFFNFVGDKNMPSENRYINMSKINLDNYKIDDLITFDFNNTKVNDFETHQSMTLYFEK